MSITQFHPYIKLMVVFYHGHSIPYIRYILPGVKVKHMVNLFDSYELILVNEGFTPPTDHLDNSYASH